MKRNSIFAIIVILLLMLVAVRAVLQPYFYDPLIIYFKNDYLYKSIPEFNYGKYFSHLFFRNLVNTIISLAIIKLTFNNLGVLIFSIKFYIISFIVLSVFLFINLKFEISQNYLLVFYVRRFLMHPLFLFILLPAFYYQYIRSKTSEND